MLKNQNKSTLNGEIVSFIQLAENAVGVIEALLGRGVIIYNRGKSLE